MTRSYCYQPFQPAPFLSASATADALQIVVDDVDVVDVVLDVYRLFFDSMAWLGDASF
jgi:hypothetical protein